MKVLAKLHNQTDAIKAILFQSTYKMPCPGNHPLHPLVPIDMAKVFDNVNMSYAEFLIYTLTVQILGVVFCIDLRTTALKGLVRVLLFLTKLS